MLISGPCLCGDPYCPRCFPRSPEDAFDPDYETDKYLQEPADAEAPDSPPSQDPAEAFPEGTASPDAAPLSSRSARNEEEET